MTLTAAMGDGGVESRHAGSPMRPLRDPVELKSRERQPKAASLRRAIAKWLFVFNSNFSRMNQAHRSGVDKRQRSDQPRGLEPTYSRVTIRSRCSQPQSLL